MSDSVEKKAEKTQTEEQDRQEVPEWVGKTGGTKVIATGNAKDNNAKVWLLLRCSKG